MILSINENPEIWKENILKALKDLSDIDMQKMAWSGKHMEYISSFTEILATLYDDFSFERYLEYYFSLYKEDKMYLELFKLNEMLKNYKTIGYELERQQNGYEIILEDSEWIKITVKASEIIQQWE